MDWKEFFKNQKWNIIVIFTSLLLLLFSILHKLQYDLGTQTYVRSIYVPLEMMLVALFFLMLLINIIFIFIYLIKKNWRLLIIKSGAIALTILLYVISTIIDSPTLMYMT